MTTRTRAPALDVEQDVDLGRYGRAIAARWWFAVAGLLLGAAIGYLISLGGTQVWTASSTVYLGSPLSGVGVLLTSPQTNPSSVNAVVHSEEAVRKAAAVAGMRPSDLRGHISTKPISAGVGAGIGQRTSQANPLVRITVRGGGARKARLAANSLARQVVDKLSPFVQHKIGYLEQRLATDRSTIAAIKRQLGTHSDPTVKAVFAVNLAQLLQDQLAAQQLLVQAKGVELPSVLTHAAAVKSAARSPRNSVVVGALLGLVIGLIAALAWEPLAARRRP